MLQGGTGLLYLIAHLANNKGVKKGEAEEKEKEMKNRKGKQASVHQ